MKKYFPHYIFVWCLATSVRGSVLSKTQYSQNQKPRKQRKTGVCHITRILQISLINLKLISHHHDIIREFRHRRCYHTTHAITTNKKKCEVRRGQKLISRVGLGTGQLTPRKIMANFIHARQVEEI